MNEPWENGKKPSFGSDFGPFDPNSSNHFFFFLKEIWFRQSLDIMVSCHQTDGRTDGQTDKSDFIEGCLTNVKRPINFFYSRTNNLNSLYTSVHLFPEKTSTKKTCAPLSNINKKYISALSKLIAFVCQVLILSEKMTRLPHSEQNMNFP